MYLMKALCWHGINDLRVDNVPDPTIINPHDVILRVTMSTTCGSDLHLIDGYLPTMKEGDILGHEFMGEVVEVGKEVKKIKRGDRVVVPSFIVCGSCWYCQNELYSLCDNTNPNAELQQPFLGGHYTAGIYGYTHAFGGYAGSHAEYVRVPFADNDCFKVPEGLTDEQVLFISDAVPTGYMGADFCNIQPGDTVAVWGCGGVGLMAAKSAYILGAERVIAIDRFPERLQMARDYVGAETLNYTEVTVLEALQDMTGGRGPDACIDAVGMEAHGTGIGYAYDRAKQALRLETDRGTALREAIMACRKGGTLSILGVYGLMDKFPIGTIINKGMTVRTAQQHGQKYVPRLLDHAVRGELDPSFLVTHRFSLEDSPKGYEMFKHKEDGCVRSVFIP
jgi:threonine dehydrogenase-like Zn-dependent dehydrogenase